MIWISCEGENPADIENLGPINYIPHRGFPGYFYPFMNQKGYMPPVLAINFERPKSKLPTILSKLLQLSLGRGWLCHRFPVTLLFSCYDAMLAYILEFMNHRNRNFLP